jgi:hypothetical protein
MAPNALPDVAPQVPQGSLRMSPEALLVPPPSRPPMASRAGGIAQGASP